MFFAALEPQIASLRPAFPSAFVAIESFIAAKNIYGRSYLNLSRNSPYPFFRQKARATAFFTETSTST